MRYDNLSGSSATTSPCSRILGWSFCRIDWGPAPCSLKKHGFVWICNTMWKCPVILIQVGDHHCNKNRAHAMQSVFDCTQWLFDCYLHSLLFTIHIKLSFSCRIIPVYHCNECKTTVWVKKIHPPPCSFQTFFPYSWKFLINFLHTYYAFLSTLDYRYKFLFNYLQLWRRYAILSETTHRIFYISQEVNF